MSKPKKIKRDLDEMSGELTDKIYRRTLDRLEGEYYGRCSAHFVDMVRRGEVCIGEDK